MSEKKLLPKKTGDLSDWYTTLIQLADLADYGPSKGSMIIKPYGYAIWELAQKALDEKFKEHGVENGYFPLFIPMSFLEKEKNHVEGFSPELAVVTHGGGEKLEEPLVVRPTSETIINDSFSKWVQSWRDLPILFNQWCNVVRWEKRTMPFLRTSEFLWQEGHTAHATHSEAIETQKWALGVYKQIYEDYFALYGYQGHKSTSERFAGADDTLTLEHLMPSGKALQSCTSHDLGQNFAKAFDISFQNKDGEQAYVWQTSWGLSTRSIGGLILAHGDDNGLRLPPKLAPIQIVILPVIANDELVDFSRNLEKSLKSKGLRVKVDDRDDERLGFKINKWEVKGVPIRIEVGKRELENNQVTVVRRWDGKKETITVEEFVQSVESRLDDIQKNMLKGAKTLVEQRTRVAKNYEEFKQLMTQEDKGFIEVYWNDNKEIEAKIKEETKASSRCMIGEGEGTDFYTGEPSKTKWVFAQSY
ncbi:MAG TPA: proline--tRNA ligase [Candidatus Saccharimonadales bacterium]|nr:proline--tRNA ligase [Candidatus Saccharimonadales bacterium]